MEYEFKPAQSGRRLTTAELVSAYIEFGRSIGSADRQLGAEIGREHSTKQGRRKSANKKPHKPMRAVASKVTGGFDYIAATRRPKFRKGYAEARKNSP